MRLEPSAMLDEPVRHPRGRCRRRMGDVCSCWRPLTHDGPCACTCELYGMEHGGEIHRDPSAHYGVANIYARIG